MRDLAPKLREHGFVGAWVSEGSQGPSLAILREEAPTYLRIKESRKANPQEAAAAIGALVPSSWKLSYASDVLGEAGAESPSGDKELRLSFYRGAIARVVFRSTGVQPVRAETIRTEARALGGYANHSREGSLTLEYPPPPHQKTHRGRPALSAKDFYDVMIRPLIGHTRMANPLQKGCARDVVGKNISTMMREGRKQPQAVAIALDTARRQGCDVPPNPRAKNPRPAKDAIATRPGETPKEKSFRKVVERRMASMLPAGWEPTAIYAYESFGTVHAVFNARSIRGNWSDGSLRGTFELYQGAPVLLTVAWRALGLSAAAVRSLKADAATLGGHLSGIARPEEYIVQYPRPGAGSTLPGHKLPKRTPLSAEDFYDVVIRPRLGARPRAKNPVDAGAVRFLAKKYAVSTEEAQTIVERDLGATIDAWIEEHAVAPGSPLAQGYIRDLLVQTYAHAKPETKSATAQGKDFGAELLIDDIVWFFDDWMHGTLDEGSAKWLAPIAKDAGAETLAVWNAMKALGGAARHGRRATDEEAAAWEAQADRIRSDLAMRRMIEQVDSASTKQIAAYVKGRELAIARGLEMPSPPQKGSKRSSNPVVKRGEKHTRVQNLGWLLRHWKDVVRFEVVGATRFRPNAQAVLLAHMRDGSGYEADFASETVLRDWINRPVFRGVPVVWFGEEKVVGQTLSLPSERRQNPASGTELLSAEDVGRLPVGSIVFSWKDGIPAYALVLLSGGRLTQISLLPERAGGMEPGGDPIENWGREFALVAKGTGKLTTHRPAQTKAIDWMNRWYASRKQNPTGPARREAEERLSRAFKEVRSGGADWLERTWFVGGLGGDGNHAEIGLFVTSRGASEDEYCLILRDLRDDAGSYDEQYKELDCASSESIDRLIAVANAKKVELLASGHLDEDDARKDPYLDYEPPGDEDDEGGCPECERSYGPAGKHGPCDHGRLATSRGPRGRNPVGGPPAYTINDLVRVDDVRQPGHGSMGKIVGLDGSKARVLLHTGPFAGDVEEYPLRALVRRMDRLVVPPAPTRYDRDPRAR